MVPGVFYGLQDHKPPSPRPSETAPTQQAALTMLIEEGPVRGRFLQCLQRSPMIQQLIYDRLASTTMSSTSPSCSRLDFSYQKQPSDHLNEQKRQEWRTTTWPQILQLTKERKALLLLVMNIIPAVGHPDIHVGAAWQPQSRPPASAKAIKSSG